MKRVLGLFAILTLLSLLACVEYRGHFSIASTRWSPPSITTTTPVAGRACYNPLGSASGALRAAAEEALSQAPGANALSDVRLRLEGRCFVVEGNAFLFK
jgi:hypothetical protein